MTKPQNLARKLIREHLVPGASGVEGDMTPGEEIAIRVDQTLSQDATGTLTYLQLEATGVDRVKTDLSVSYIDHNMLQADFRNADDHAYLQDVAAKYGVHFSRPGNGICHQVHLERFAVPGASLVGTDSHTPTCGGVGSLAIGSGGLDVAVAMAGGPYHMRMPQILGVELTGSLTPGVSAKDIILQLLRQLTVKGGVGRILEYHGSGVKTLTVTQRATITNMGAELGATTSLFPSDEMTLDYLTRQGRAESFTPLAADEGAAYDEDLTIDLATLVPLIACPDSPDAVVPVTEVAGTPVDQVAVGSCTNSSFADLSEVAAILKGHTVHPNVTTVMSPGSRQVLQMIAQSGAMADIVASGVRLLESACGPCAGIGQVPGHGAVSVRSFNRNFPGRSGGMNNSVYLASPAVCAATAIAGVIADPRDYLTADSVAAALPDRYVTDDSGIIAPAQDPDSVQIRRGPNIKPVPTREPLDADLDGAVLIKLGDNISTDHILPAGTTTLALRSNVPAIAEYVFNYVDDGFVGRAKALGGGVIVAGENYGQGSSREHAALAPAYLGVRIVLAKSFARIHQDNLVNYGILPLTFADGADYDAVETGSLLVLIDARSLVQSGAVSMTLGYGDPARPIETTVTLSERQRKILLAGGLLRLVGEESTGEETEKGQTA
jgi:aconitate hydratase